LERDLPTVMKEINDFEIIASLSFVSYYQKCAFPEFTESAELTFQNLYHPLIEKEKRVANSFASKDSVVMITGSNMSGKSTFLRTMGINQVMALIGGAEAGYRYYRFSREKTGLNDDLNLSGFYALLLVGVGI